MDVNAIHRVDLTSSQVGGTTIQWGEVFSQAGKEHYKLLHWCAAQAPAGSTIFDIGTHRGASAVALASGNRAATVESFDIEHKYPLAEIPNVRYHLDNLMTEEGRAIWKDRLLSAPFILLDIDPHEGTRELEFIGWLRDNSYAGYVICDDIWYFKEMRDNFWYQIPGYERVDVTAVGHWSGTGIIRFPASASAETMRLWPAEASPVPSNWTVVTGYFDLTKMPDASTSIKARPAKHYLENARATLAVEQNLMIFCEPEMVEEIKALRPAWLLEKYTKIVPISFEDFPMTKYRGQIQKNRQEKPYHFDDRNTASYYLLCMARYAMLKMAIAENPFQSTHFCWLNICIERMGWANLPALERVWRAQRDKFSTCWIDYLPAGLVKNLPEYYKWGRCTMCSGFFTGNAEYMKKFCDAIEGAFLRVLEAGYGHADEQLFSVVYFDGNQDIFEHYYGDYQQMVENYVEPRTRPSEPLRLVIPRSLAAGDYEVCEKACAAMWNGWKKGKVILETGQFQQLADMYRDSLRRQGKGVELP